MYLVCGFRNGYCLDYSPTSLSAVISGGRPPSHDDNAVVVMEQKDDEHRPTGSNNFIESYIRIVADHW